MRERAAGAPIAGGSPTFERLQKGGVKRPMWMTATWTVAALAAVGAVAYASYLNRPGQSAATTAPAVTAPAASAPAPVTATVPQPAAPVASPRIEHHPAVQAARKADSRPAVRRAEHTAQPAAQSPTPVTPTIAPSAPAPTVNPTDSAPTAAPAPVPAPAPTTAAPADTTPPN